MKHRWPTSLHSQTEAVFHASARFARQRRTVLWASVPSAPGRSTNTRPNAFVALMIGNGRTSILHTAFVHDDMAVYLEERLAYYVEKKRSRQTMETILSALGKFEYAINHYIEIHTLDIPRLETEKLRMKFYARSRKLLRKSSKIFDNRAYPDPIRLIAVITDGTFQLQASLQYEGGLRAEGVRRLPATGG